jgi:DNA (cytosine-5)-methyltransferase 1
MTPSVATALRPNHTQLSMLSFNRQTARFARNDQPLIVDNFAGGGGVSLGIEYAFNRCVDVAINHDPDAIEMHEVNHPNTHHETTDVFDVQIEAICGGRPIGLAWFSPDCTHHSQARGFKPVDKHIRGLAWIACKYAQIKRPWTIVLENVGEFRNWSPTIPYIKDGKIQLTSDGKIKYIPDPTKQGFTFKRFIARLRNLGYSIDWRILNSADYGAPTARRRFFLIAKADNQPIIWPEKTHGSPDSIEVQNGTLLPYRTAAECIDWSLPVRSIFERKKPLVHKTLRRVAIGTNRFVFQNPKPYITTVDGEPVSTKHLAEANKLIASFLLGAGGPSNAAKPVSIARPLNTIMPENHRALAVIWLAKFYGTAIGCKVDKPLPTITAGAGGGHMAEVRALLTQYKDDIAEYCKSNNIPEDLILEINGERYVIYDIGLRMLTPKELAQAQFGWAEDGRSLSADYILTGTQGNQTAKIGNSVPPLIVSAIVKANCPYLIDHTALPLAA